MDPHPPTLISTAAFLKRQALGFRREPREKLLPFLNWYWKDGRIGIVREGPRILAVAVARCLAAIEQANEPYHHEDTGEIVWIDAIASRHPLGIPFLLRQAQLRFGPRRAYAGHVFKRDGELRMLPTKTVERLTMNLQHHGITIYSGATAAA